MCAYHFFLSLTLYFVCRIGVNFLREFFYHIEFRKLFQHLVNLSLLGSALLAELVAHL